MQKYHKTMLRELENMKPLSSTDLLNALVAHLGVPDMEITPTPTKPQNVKQESQLYPSTAPVDETMDPLKFWEVCTMKVYISGCSNYLDPVTQVHQKQFPVLFAIAMDYLPIQASSIPCKRVFFLSSTDMK